MANSVNMKRLRQSSAIFLFLLSFTGKAQTTHYNLVQMQRNGQIMIVHKSATNGLFRITDFTVRPAESFRDNAWMNVVTFTNGRIFIVLRGMIITVLCFIA